VYKSSYNNTKRKIGRVGIFEGMGVSKGASKLGGCREDFWGFMPILVGLFAYGLDKMCLF
jgi:hypothetical protein